MDQVWPLTLQFLVRHGLILELAVSIAMFTWWLPRRPWFAARLSGGVTATIAASMLWYAVVPDLPSLEMIWFMLLLGAFSLIICRCWVISYSRGLLYLVAGGVMQHLAFRGADLVQALTVRTSLVEVDDANVIYAIALVPFYLVGFFLFARRLWGKALDGVQSRSILLLLIGMLVCVNLFKYLFDLSSTDRTNDVYLLFSFFDLITCVFLLALLNEIIGRASALQTNETLEQLIYQQKRQMESSRETIDLINVKAHDLKQQLSLLQGRVDTQEIDDLQSLVNVYDATVRTGNDALDITLAEKSLLCSQRGVRFEHIVDGAELDFIAPSDIYALFGNALDNALEAVERLPEGDDIERYIALHVRRIKGMLSIHVENPYIGGVRFGPTGLPLTTKPDLRHHGFGMLSIQMICEKHHGWVSVNAANAVFELNILLPVASTERGADHALDIAS